MDFLAEDLDPTLQSDLYYCHGFVKAFKKVFKFVHGFADKDFLSEAQSFCRQIRDLKEKSKGPQRESKRQPESNRDQLASIRYQLRKRFNEELINAEAKSNRTAASGLGYVTSSLDPQSKSESEWLVERFLDSALVFDDYVAPAVQRFYFGKACQLTTAGMIRSEVQEKPSQHSASIDLEV